MWYTIFDHPKWKTQINGDTDKAKIAFNEEHFVLFNLYKETRRIDGTTTFKARIGLMENAVPKATIEESLTHQLGVLCHFLTGMSEYHPYMNFEAPGYGSWSKGGIHLPEIYGTEYTWKSLGKIPEDEVKPVHEISSPYKISVQREPLLTDEKEVNLSAQIHAVSLAWMNGEERTIRRLSTDGENIWFEDLLVGFKWKGYRFLIKPSGYYPLGNSEEIYHYAHFRIIYQPDKVSNWFAKQDVKEGSISESLRNYIKANLEEDGPHLRIKNPPPLDNIQRVIWEDPEVVPFEAEDDRPVSIRAAEELLKKVTVEPEYDDYSPEYVFMTHVEGYDFWYAGPEHVVIRRPGWERKVSIGYDEQDDLSYFAWQIVQIFRLPMRPGYSFPPETPYNLTDLQNGKLLVGIRIGNWDESMWKQVGKVVSSPKTSEDNIRIELKDGWWSRNSLLEIPDEL